MGLDNTLDLFNRKKSSDNSVKDESVWVWIMRWTWVHSSGGGAPSGGRVRDVFSFPKSAVAMSVISVCTDTPGEFCMLRSHDHFQQ